MNIKEYIEADLPFYHIAHLRNKDSIIENGIKNGKRKIGVCVVRSSDLRIIDIIADTQLSFDSVDNRYCVFKIIPSKHNISYTDVKEDTEIYEPTNPLHNYIRKNSIAVTVDDVFIEDRIITNIPFKKYVDELNNEGLILTLDYD